VAVVVVAQKPVHPLKPERMFAADATLSPVDDLRGVTFEGATGEREGVANSRYDVGSVHQGLMPDLRLVPPG
jgi:hypothetical protein